MQRLDRGGFERLVVIERRQDAGQSRRQHGFTRARRSDHEQTVTARGGDFERPARAMLTLDIAQIQGLDGFCRFYFRRLQCQLFFIVQMRSDF